MSFFTNIYIVVVETTGQMLESRKWYWDRAEATEVYNDAVDEFGDTRIVTLYSIDMEDTIEESVSKFMGNRHSLVNRPPLQEIRSSRKAVEEEEAVWGELEFRPEGSFYIERTKASTSEYWPYRVEVNESHEGGYVVIDHTTDTLIGVIVPSSNTAAFKAAVNGYEADQQFTNLKGAVVHIATEYNGI